MESLRDLLTPCADTADKAQQDYGLTSGNITVHFLNWKKALLGYIATADIVIGCVAWLTTPIFPMPWLPKRA
jgi:hypothetical protein